MNLKPIVSGLPQRFKFCTVYGITFAVGAVLHAEPMHLIRPEATVHAGNADELACVIDGVPAGPRGWSPASKVSEPQALVVRCKRPVEADELDIALFFLAGRPMNAIADFALSYTTDAEPSLAGNWQPLEIQRFSAEVTTLRRAGPGRLVSEMPPRLMTGTVPDDVYRIEALLPGRYATGFRLDVFPIKPYDRETPGLSWHAPYDFSLTEFRVAEHARETTNIALQRPVKASHPLEILMVPGALTDGLPATIAHPGKPDFGSDFWFEIDLGRVVHFDHIGLRTRGDDYLDRFSRIARDIHDDLGISLTQIAMQCEVIEDDFGHPEQMRQHVAELSSSARAVTRAVDEIVWAVTPGNDTLEKFTAFIGQFVQNCLRPTGLACRLALPAELPDLPMEATVRHHLYLVVREALNNIIRHAHAQTVRFTLSLEGRALTLTLTDDGAGFDLNPDSNPAGERLFSGNGLSNMRKRMDEIGGTMEIISTPGSGTTLTLRLMW